MTNSRGKCLGEPIGWNGGELAFCDAPVRADRRFCDRCQLIAVIAKRKRVASLLAQYNHEKEELYSLEAEGRQ